MYGFPCSPGKHLQEAAPFLSLHSAFIPQGEGRHGSIISGAGEVAKDFKLIDIFHPNKFLLVILLHCENGSPS